MKEDELSLLNMFRAINHEEYISRKEEIDEEKQTKIEQVSLKE